MVLPGWSWLDEDGRPRAILDADEHGSPGLLLVDRLGQPRATLRVSPSNSASLVLEGLTERCSAPPPACSEGDCSETSGLFKTPDISEQSTHEVG